MRREIKTCRRGRLERALAHYRLYTHGALEPPFTLAQIFQRCRPRRPLFFPQHGPRLLLPGRKLSLGDDAMLLVNVNHLLHLVVAAEEDAAPVVDVLGHHRQHASHVAVDGLAAG